MEERAYRLFPLPDQASLTIWEVSEFCFFCQHYGFRGFDKGLHDKEEVDWYHFVSLLDAITIVDIAFLISQFRC